MKYLYLYPIEGLYNELFSPNPESIIDDVEIHNCILDANGYFWSEIFDEKNIKDLIGKLKLYSVSKVELSPQFLSVLSNIDNFLFCIQEAKINICDQGNSNEEFFKYLETINILIDLYNRFGKYNNCILSIQDGFLLDDYSYKNLNDKCLIDKYNPYLDIVINKVVPKIEEYNPDLIFVVGKPNYYNVAITKILKSKNKELKFCITRHSSEYYSLNKITSYLKKNELLFLDFDYILLEYFNYTERLLLNVLKHNGDIFTIPNIMLRNDLNEIIVTNDNQISSTTVTYKLLKRTYNNPTFRVNPEDVADIHIAPYSKCYWNKCTFCGINKKYFHDYKESKYSDFFNNVENMISDLGNIKYLWFIDEALTIDQLTIIADCFLKHNLTVFWQARTRIDKKLLLSNVSEKLYKAGLRELRLGLESASINTLRNMNKFEADFSLGLVEQIIEKYTSSGISIHFPIIIGFPGESDYDRHLTYEFLKNITNHNNMVTFNINILNLDVSSTLFKSWYNFSISSAKLPCLPEHFIGNIADWDGNKCDFNDLEKERNAFMRETLYDWYPQNSLTKPVVYYRLIESIRNTLIIKSNNSKIDLQKESDKTVYRLSDKIIISSLTNSVFLIYNWNTHHYFKCDSEFIKIMLIWKIELTIQQFKYHVNLKYPNIIDEKNLDVIISKIIKDKYLLQCK